MERKRWGEGYGNGERERGCEEKDCRNGQLRLKILVHKKTSSSSWDLFYYSQNPAKKITDVIL